MYNATGTVFGVSISFAQPCMRINSCVVVQCLLEKASADLDVTNAGGCLPIRPAWDFRIVLARGPAPAVRLG